MTGIIIAAGKPLLTGHAAGMLAHRRPHFYSIADSVTPAGLKSKV